MGVGRGETLETSVQKTVVMMLRRLVVNWGPRIRRTDRSRGVVVRGVEGLRCVKMLKYLGVHVEEWMSTMV